MSTNYCYTQTVIHHFLDQIISPSSSSHKGQNGKVLIIGGSDLFHAASQWSFLAASRWVDMVFYSSVEENNEIVRASKMVAHDGVVIARKDLPSYMEEVEVILIGPGMRRDVESRFSPEELKSVRLDQLTEDDWENDTKAVVSALLLAYPHKKWILDAGALQVVDTGIIPQGVIMTPHQQEFFRVVDALGESRDEWYGLLSLVRENLSTEETSSREAKIEEWSSLSPEYMQKLTTFSQKIGGATILVKGEVDLLWDSTSVYRISGGNGGMTKGGTGDALAGMTAGFWTHSPALASLAVSSFLNKQAAHELYLQQGLMYNTTDLVNRLPFTWGELQA